MANALPPALRWETAVAGSALFLKASADARATNLLMISESKDGPRPYRLSLRLAPPGTEALYELRFEVAPTPADTEAALEAERARVIDQTIKAAAFVGPRNFDYVVQGDEALQPSEISDNGRFTLLRFPGQQPLPAIYAVSSDGAEQLVNFDVRGEFVVVHRVALMLRLRRGRSVLCIRNLAHRSPATALDSGAASEAVRRAIAGTRP